jgi:hypothetical protein
MPIPVFKEYPNCISAFCSIVSKPAPAYKGNENKGVTNLNKR